MNKKSLFDLYVNIDHFKKKELLSLIDLIYFIFLWVESGFGVSEKA